MPDPKTKIDPSAVPNRHIWDSIARQSQPVNLHPMIHRMTDGPVASFDDYLADITIDSGAQPPEVDDAEVFMDSWINDPDRPADPKSFDSVRAYLCGLHEVDASIVAAAETLWRAYEQETRSHP